MIAPVLYWQEKIDGSYALVLNDKEVFDCSWEQKEVITDLFKSKHFRRIAAEVTPDTPSYDLDETNPHFPYSDHVFE